MPSLQPAPPAPVLVAASPSGASPIGQAPSSVLGGRVAPMRKPSGPAARSHVVRPELALQWGHLRLRAPLQREVCTARWGDAHVSRASRCNSRTVGLTAFGPVTRRASTFPAARAESPPKPRPLCSLGLHPPTWSLWLCLSGTFNYTGSRSAAFMLRLGCHTHGSVFRRTR